MPELPEVETVRRGLERVLDGAEVIAAEARREALRFPLPVGLCERITGRRVSSISRRAKYLLIGLDDGQALISHLGMSGSWRIEGRPGEQAAGSLVYPHSKNIRHDHFVMQVARNEGIFDIIYNDPRRFGFLLLADNAALASHPLLCKLGIEPTGNALSGNFLQQAFTGKSTSLKAALLDQRIIAGLGNIYVCEALWRARLSPFRKAMTLAIAGKQAQVEAAELAAAICAVIAEAIAAGGSHLRDYLQADGSPGYFQNSFAVYGREGNPCQRCGVPVKRLVQAGRSTFYCEHCQI